MAYVITEACVAVCETECVEVCPVECIHGPLSPAQLALVPSAERPRRLAGIQLYINPETCTGCGACAGVCPVGAIFEESELPAKSAHCREANARYFAG